MPVLFVLFGKRLTELLLIAIQLDSVSERLPRINRTKNVSVSAKFVVLTVFCRITNKEDKEILTGDTNWIGFDDPLNAVP